jgi:hypothetical protein
MRTRSPPWSASCSERQWPGKTVVASQTPTPHHLKTCTWAECQPGPDGIATDLAWRYPGDHRISVLAAAALVPRLALLLGLVTPAALNLANHIIDRRENDVTLHHLDPDQEPEMLDQDHLLGTDVWHANIHLAFRAHDQKWNGSRVFSIGVPHQPLDPVTQKPSTTLPIYDDWPIVGIRLEQITYSKSAPKMDQPVIGRDSLRTHYKLYHPDHQLPPSECARSPIAQQDPMPVVISAPNPNFSFQERTMILADGDRAQPFGVTNENRRSWISSQLVDAHPGLIKEPNPSGLFCLEGMDVHCARVVKNVAVVLFQSHGTVAEVLLDLYVLDLRALPPMRGMFRISDGCLGRCSAPILAPCPTVSP